MMVPEKEAKTECEEKGGEVGTAEEEVETVVALIDRKSVV